MGELPSLSAVLVNYNHGRYLAEALQAVLEQSYPPLEIIVVDDASQDDSISIIQAFARNHPAIRLLTNDRNQGTVFSANRGLQSATSDYVVFIAADDKILPGLFEKSMLLLASHPRAGACTVLVRLVDESGRDLGEQKDLLISTSPRYVSPDDARQILLDYGPWNMSPGAIYKRQSYLECGGFRPELGSSSDAFLFVMLALRDGVCFIPEPLATWRQAAESYSSRTYADPAAMRQQVHRAMALARTEFPGLCPESLLTRWEARWTYSACINYLDALSKKRLFGLRLLFPHPSLLDRTFIACLEAASALSLLLFKTCFFIRLKRWDAWPVLANKLGLDRTVLVSLASKVGTLLASAIGLWMIGTYLTRDLQGYYYTFASILGLQTFADLGFCLVITNFASHEWAQLDADKDGRITGNPEHLSRLVSLGRLVIKWYALASVIVVLGVGTAGYLFLSSNPHTGIIWLGPWLCLTVLAGVKFGLAPMLSLLEGCNQVANINALRLVHRVSANAVLWTALVLGLGLWVAPISAAAEVLAILILLAAFYARFFRPFISQPPGPRMSWRGEIWPMQWRLAISAFAGYFTYSLFTPVMFHYHGPAVAGQMGMSLTLVAAPLSIASVWLASKIPDFGMLIANKEYATLDRLLLKLTKAAVLAVCAGSAVVWLLVYLLYHFDHRLAGRVLPPLPTAIFLFAHILTLLGVGPAYYLRAHKEEPLMVISVVTSLAIGILVWLLGSRLGPLGAACGYLSVIAFLMFPWLAAIFLRKRAACLNN
ncbi:MAG: glycosyltransferase [Elusimicrobia bacterium]|nr:glycosyltransferase [Elusimicrobiota bacterium]